MRHAKSAWDTDAPTDFERPLAKRGRRDGPRIGAWLRASDLVPDRIFASTAERARQTALAVSAEMGFDADAIEWHEGIYMAGLRSLLSVLASAEPGARRVMIVGHNPGLEGLVEYLASAPVPIPANGKIMPTAAVAHFRMPADWEELAPGAAELVRITRPKELR